MGFNFLIPPQKMGQYLPKCSYENSMGLIERVISIYGRVEYRLKVKHCGLSFYVLYLIHWLHFKNEENEIKLKKPNL